MADQRKFYNRGFISNRKPPEGVRCAHGNLEVTVLETNMRQAGDKQVLSISTIGTFAGPSGIAYTLGEDVFANADGTIFINVNCWDYVKDNVEKMNLQHGDRINVHGYFVRNEYKTRNGEARVNVQINAERIELVKRSAKRDEIAEMENGANPIPAPAASPAPAPAPAPADEPVVPAFTIPEGLDTERLPFV